MKGKDVVNALYKAMSENPSKKMSELFDIARKKEAPRFYVSFDNARRIVSMLDRGLELPIVNENKRAMFGICFVRALSVMLCLCFLTIIVKILLQLKAYPTTIAIAKPTPASAPRNFAKC